MRRLGLTLSLLAVGLLPCKAIAQIQPDATLGAENSQVTTAIQDGVPTSNIAGGAVRGSNLFHSFEQFSLPAGEAVLFRSDGAIANIFSRVTGGGLSSLDGRLAVEGNTNLFVLNPAGIVIGPNAQLDLRGSFTASAAEGFRFADGFIYNSSVNNSGVGGVTAAPPLLTVSAPVGVVWGDRPGPIQVFSQSPDPATGLGSGLKVNPGQTLSLIGGGIALDGATLQAPSGKISLLSAGDIRLANQSLVNVSGVGGGEIEVEGQDIVLTERSALISDTFGEVDGKGIWIEGDRLRLQDGSSIGAATLGNGNGSNIAITTNESIELSSTSIFNFKVINQLNALQGIRQPLTRTGGISTETSAPGQAGQITLNTQRLRLDNGAIVSAETLGVGNGGNIQINAAESIELNGSGIVSNGILPGIAIFDEVGAFTGVSTAGIPAGSTGNITLNTKRLLAENGSGITTVTLTDGDAGDIVIDAIEAVEVRKFFDPIPTPTTINTVTMGGIGQGGNIQIQTGRLRLEGGTSVLSESGALAFVGEVTNGGPAGDIFIQARESVEVVGGHRFFSPFTSDLTLSLIAASTRSEFPAGSIDIRTPSLLILDGGLISGTTLGSAPGGQISIAAENVLISGEIPLPGEVSASAVYVTSGASAELSIRLEPSATTASGQGGSVNIKAKNLVVEEGGILTVDSFGVGAAGNLNIEAAQMRVDQQGQVTARTIAEQGGNINLSVSQLLQLRNHAEISATAEGTGNGGNINFKGGIILAVPGENSDFIANAFEGQGGRINLSAQDILGLTPISGFSTAELRQNTMNDISASSELGSPGEVQLQNLAVSPEQGLAELPGEPLGGERLIEQNICSTGNQGSEFVVTGRGGIPLAAGDAALESVVIWQEAGGPGLSQERAALAGQPLEAQPGSIAPEVTEATHLDRLGDGQIVLLPPIAAPKAALYPARSAAISCQSIRGIRGGP